MQQTRIDFGICLSSGEKAMCSDKVSLEFATIINGTLFIRNHVISKLHVECQNISRIYTTKGKFPKELFIVKTF